MDGIKIELEPQIKQTEEQMKTTATS